MSLPRPVVPRIVYLLSRRCAQRQNLLRPDSKVNQIFRFCLAYAAARTGVRVHCYQALSNHYHLVVTDLDSGAMSTQEPARGLGFQIATAERATAIADTLQVLGQAALKENQLALAETTFKELGARHPDHPRFEWWQTRIGWACYLQNNYDDAIAGCRQSLGSKVCDRLQPVSAKELRQGDRGAGILAGRESQSCQR